jgi:hypothetical protein
MTSHSARRKNEGELADGAIAAFDFIAASTASKPWANCAPPLIGDFASIWSATI